MAIRTDLDEIQVGRNYVRIGDDVKVKPSRKGKRDGFIARVTSIYRDAGEEVCVEVYGGRRNQRGDLIGVGVRSFPLSRIQRVRQTRNGGEKIDRRRKAG